MCCEPCFIVPTSTTCFTRSCVFDCGIKADSTVSVPVQFGAIHALFGFLETAMNGSP